MKYLLDVNALAVSTLPIPMRMATPMPTSRLIRGIARLRSS